MPKKILHFIILFFLMLSVNTVPADSTVSVDVTSVYKITGETVNGIPRYVLNLNIPTGYTNPEKNVTILNDQFEYNQYREVGIRNSTEGQYYPWMWIYESILVEKGNVRSHVHYENTSVTSCGNYVDCWISPEVIGWNVSVDIYAYPRFYLVKYKMWGNWTYFATGNFYVLGLWKKVYTNPAFDTFAIYYNNGTYQNVTQYPIVPETKAYTNEKITFSYDSQDHNKTVAVFHTYKNFTNNEYWQHWWHDYDNRTSFIKRMEGMTGAKIAETGWGVLFADSGAKSLEENYSVWLGFKDQWFDYYYPASIVPITGTYQGRDNITGTYNFTVGSDGLLRFNFSTNNIKHYLPVFHIKDVTSSTSSYKDHVWMKNDSLSNPTWQKLTNYTDFVIQDGNSTYFGYNYILLLINKTLGSDYEFWIDDNTDPPTLPGAPSLGPTFGQGTALYFYTGEKVDGNVTVIPVENPENKTTTNFTNGEWSINFDMITKDVQYLTFIINDDGKIGYSQVTLDNNNPKQITNCVVQNISLSGYAVDINTGNQINSGNVRVSVVYTVYTNITSFSGSWSIDLHPCLISGKIYTLHILISDNSGKTGEMFETYSAR